MMQISFIADRSVLSLCANIEAKLNIFNIQRFSVYDGPGIRTVIFCKGCNLRCRWCHNPESFLSSAELEFNPEKCIACGDCFRTCPQAAHKFDVSGVHRINRKKCKTCFICAQGCYAEALRQVGTTVSADYLVQTVLADKPYYAGAKGGGVTFSGGECMLQADALLPVLRLLQKEDIHVALDTAGHVPYAEFEKVLPHINLILYDIKAMDACLHQKLTGTDNSLILENFERLCKSTARVLVRIPHIPGYNEGEFPAIGKYLQSKKISTAVLMPYHSMGEGKAHLLGQDYLALGIQSPKDEAINSALETLRSYGIDVSL